MTALHMGEFPAQAVLLSVVRAYKRCSSTGKQLAQGADEGNHGAVAGAVAHEADTRHLAGILADISVTLLPAYGGSADRLIAGRTQSLDSTMKRGVTTGE